MPKSFNIILFFLFVPTLLYGHEEPPKTLKEKKDKTEDSRRIARQKIRAANVYKTTYDSSGLPLERYLHQRTEYLPSGYIASITQYATTGKPLLSVRYEYDSDFNMITDADYDSSGRNVEKILYRYDDSGRVVSSENFKDGQRVSRFVYQRNPLNQKVYFSKYAANDSLEYHIDYIYTAPLDEGRLTTIYKFRPDADTMVFVEYRYTVNGKVAQKWVWGANRQLSHYFEYFYDSAGQRTQIRKILPGNITEWTQHFWYDKQNNINRTDVRNESGKTVSLLEYEYEYYR